MSTRGIELELPDLPEVPISLGPAPTGLVAPRAQGSARLWDALTAWLPLLLMAFLALGTWWLVKNAPQPVSTGAAPAPRAAPDYTMSEVTLQRFGSDGRLRLQIEGQALRHWPQAEEIEIDTARIQVWSLQGQATMAQANRVVAQDDGTEVRLTGQARVIGKAADGSPTDIRSESLRLMPPQQRVLGEDPVDLRWGTHRLSAGGIEADQRTGLVTLSPPVRGVFTPPHQPNATQ